MTVESLLTRSSRAIASGDWEVLAGLLSDRFFQYEPRDHEPTAAKRIVEILSDLKRAVPDLGVVIDDVVADGEVFTGVLTLSGTHSNPLWGVPGSGNHIHWANPVTIKLIDNRLAIRFDDAAFPVVIASLRQFGLVNPPEAMDQPPQYPVSVPEFLLKVVMTGQAADKECGHLDQIRVTEPGTRICAQCVAQGVNWPALRMCLTCGFVGCCDTSRNKHMKGHHETAGHPLMRSIRMDEGWVWCYEDNAFFEKSLLDTYRET